MRYKKIATLLITSLLASATGAQGRPPAQAQPQAQTQAQTQAKTQVQTQAKTQAKTQASMRFGPGNTPGWSLMTPQERAEHRSKMMGFTNYEDCASYLAKHHAMMLERARNQGVTLPAEPRPGFCQRLPHQGGSN